MIDLVAQAFGMAAGAIITGAMVLAIYRRDAGDWTRLSSVYGRDWLTPRLHKQFANMILYSDGRPAKSYAGIISIGLHDDGVALRPNRFLAPYQSPIFIPYADISGWRQEWYINAQSAELSFSKAPEIRLIMPRKQVDWMLSLAGDAANISQARLRHGARPWRTQLSAMVFGALAMLIIVILLVKGLQTTWHDFPREPDLLKTQRIMQNDPREGGYDDALKMNEEIL